jgi:D-alanyl-D-alanine carboxypeptidase
MLKLSPYLILASISLGISSGMAFANCGKQLNTKIQKVIDDYHKKYHIPGISVSISCPGEDAPRDFVAGSTTLDGKKSLTPDNLLQIADLTQIFVATLMLQLEAEGKLSIYDPIWKYLDNLPASWQNIKIINLLNHTSMLPDYVDYSDLDSAIISEASDKEWTAMELISQVFDEPLADEWLPRYTNYVLAGLIIENVTHNKLADALNTGITKPLGLKNTYYSASNYPSDVLAQMVHGYVENPLQMMDADNNLLDITNFNTSWHNSAAGMLATTHDVSIFLQKLLIDKTLLPKKQYKELLTSIDLDTGKIQYDYNLNGVGLGLYGYNHPEYGTVWVNSGETFGYQATAIWLKCNNITISIATNVTPEIVAIDAITESEYLEAPLPLALMYTVASEDKEHNCRMDHGHRYKAALEGWRMVALHP